MFSVHKHDLIRTKRPSPFDRPTVCPTVHSSVRPSPSDRPPVRPTVRPTVRSSVRPSVRPSDRPTVRPFVRPSSDRSPKESCFGAFWFAPNTTLGMAGQILFYVFTTLTWWLIATVRIFASPGSTTLSLHACRWGDKLQPSQDQTLSHCHSLVSCA